LATTAIVALLAATSAHAQQGPFLYVPNSGSNDLFVVDTSTNSVTAGPIPMGLNPNLDAASRLCVAVRVAKMM
jgi:YVTN family beta-propeller protein